jgi:hypothetical protein
MIKTYREDIIYIGISVLIILISFFPIDYFISHEIPIWIWDKLDLYSLLLIPVAISFFLFRKFRVSLTITYSFILFQFHFYTQLPWEFRNQNRLPLTFIFIIALFILGVYFLSNGKYGLKKRIFNIKYFSIGNYILIAISLFISSLELENSFSFLIYALLLASIILTAIYNQQNWKINFLIFAIASIVIQTFYLGCFLDIHGDISFIDFSIKNMWTNCSKNYLWLISGLTILYMTINRSKYAA